MSKIILTASGKGGVGKSTFSSVVGYALAKRGKKTLLIELDSGLRCLDNHLALSSVITFDLSDALCSRCELIKTIYTCPFCKSLDLIPASFDEKFSPSDHGLPRLLVGLRHYWNYIIVDCPAGVGPEVACAASVADISILVAAPEEISVKDAAKAAKVISENGNSKKRLVINSADKSAVKLYKPNNFDNIIDTVGAKLLGVIPYDRHVHEATPLGKPLNLSSKAGIAFSNIAARLDGEERALKFRKF